MNHKNTVSKGHSRFFKHAIANIAMSLTIIISTVSTVYGYSTTIDVDLNRPIFSFILENHLASQHEIKLTPSEYALSKKLKPLLAANNYQQAIDLINNSKNTEKSTALLLITGQIYLALQQTEQAEKILSEVLKKAPSLVRAHRSLAALYLQSNQLTNAQHHLTKAITLGVQDPQFFGQLAYIHLEQGAPWSAIAGYQQALLLQPDNLQWKKGLLYALQQAGNDQSALNLVDELLNETPNNKALWLQRAQITLSLEHKNKALASMEMALRLGEEKPVNYLSTAQLHLATGSMNRAAELLKVLATKKNQSFNDIQPAIAWLINEGENKQAISILKQFSALKSLPKTQQSLYLATLGNALQDTQPKQAIKHFKKSLKLNPNQAGVLVALAQYYHNNDQFSLAEIYYQRAEIFAEYAQQSLSGLAQLAINTKQYHKALTYLEKLKNISSNKQVIDKNIAIVQRLQAQQTASL